MLHIGQTAPGPHGMDGVVRSALLGGHLYSGPVRPSSCPRNSKAGTKAFPGHLESPIIDLRDTWGVPEVIYGTPEVSQN